MRFRGWRFGWVVVFGGLSGWVQPSHAAQLGEVLMCISGTPAQARFESLSLREAADEGYDFRDLAQIESQGVERILEHALGRIEKMSPELAVEVRAALKKTSDVPRKAAQEALMPPELKEKLELPQGCTLVGVIAEKSVVHPGEQHSTMEFEVDEGMWARLSPRVQAAIWLQDALAGASTRLKRAGKNHGSYGDDPSFWSFGYRGTSSWGSAAFRNLTALSLADNYLPSLREYFSRPVGWKDEEKLFKTSRDSNKKTFEFSQGGFVFYDVDFWRTYSHYVGSAGLGFWSDDLLTGRPSDAGALKGRERYIGWEESGKEQQFRTTSREACELALSALRKRAETFVDSLAPREEWRLRARMNLKFMHFLLESPSRVTQREDGSWAFRCQFEIRVDLPERDGAPFALSVGEYEIDTRDTALCKRKSEEISAQKGVLLTQRKIVVSKSLFGLIQSKSCKISTLEIRERE